MTENPIEKGHERSEELLERQEEALGGGIIDTHTHPGIPTGGRFDSEIKRVNDEIREEYGDVVEGGEWVSPIDALLNYDIQNSDILSKRVVVPIDARRGVGAYLSNERVLELAGEYEEIIPAASFDPRRDDAVETVKEACENGVRYFKTSPPSQHFVPEEDIGQDIVDVLDSYEAILQIHTGREPDNIAKGVRHDLEDPTLSEGLLERADDALIQFLHGGAPNTDYTEKIIDYVKGYKNARTDVSSDIWTIFPDNEETVELIAAAQDEYTEDGRTVGEKTYYGSDAPVGMPEITPSEFYEMTAEKGIAYGGNEEVRERLGYD